MMILEVVKKLRNQGLGPQLYFYRDSHGNEVDLLILQGYKFTAVEIKSAQTFQPEFVSGIKYFQLSITKGSIVEAVVWYNGKQQTIYKDAKVSNPLLHGMDL